MMKVGQWKELLQFNKIEVELVQFPNIEKLDRVQHRLTQQLAAKDGLRFTDFTEWVKGCSNELDTIINF